MPKRYSQKDISRLKTEIVSILSKQKKWIDEAISEIESDNMHGDEIFSSVESVCRNSRDFASETHGLKLIHDWTVPPQPEWMDHFVDQYYQLRKDSATLWMERGVYGVLALKRGGRFLELCCGDGYNSFHFYSPFAGTIVATDFDGDALRHAREYNSKENILYQERDIRSGLPEGPFDNVLWDGAIEHFTEAEIDTVLRGVKGVLAEGGIVSGYTIVEKAGGKHLEHHEREFRSMEDLAGFLTPHFRNVTVFETIHPTRHNLYFYASDAAVPFDPGWPHALRFQR